MHTRIIESLTKKEAWDDYAFLLDIGLGHKAAPLCISYRIHRSKKRILKRQD